MIDGMIAWWHDYIWFYLKLWLVEKGYEESITNRPLDQQTGRPSHRNAEVHLFSLSNLWFLFNQKYQFPLISTKTWRTDRPGYGNARTHLKTRRKHSTWVEIHVPPRHHEQVLNKFLERDIDFERETLTERTVRNWRNGGRIGEMTVWQSEGMRDWRTDRPMDWPTNGFKDRQTDKWAQRPTDREGAETGVVAF